MPPKRQRFRDLLFNSIFIPQGDPAWEESMYCLELLNKIEVAGLYTLAKIIQADRNGSVIAQTNYGQYQWLLIPRELAGKQPRAETSGKFEDLTYSPTLVEKQIHALSNQMNLVGPRNLLVTMGNSATAWNFPYLTPEGEMLVKWTMAPF
jgi:hypothetical protein